MQFGFQRFRVVKDKLTGLYKCHLCSYRSAYGSSLRSHFAVHSSARPYGCDICSYEAKRLPDLKKHKILKHIRKGCGGGTSSTLSNKSPLQVFRDPGTGLYRCQHCSYQSDNARCVRSHLAVHSHLRPYACDTCSYEAKRSSDLSKHKIIKHGRVPLRRNKRRNPPVPKPDHSSQLTVTGVYNTSGMPPPQSVHHQVPSASCSGRTGLGTELDNCDVLSDLDYSLMSPTRAAFEALRRCNMEPYDMFNEYSSSHDSFLHNAIDGDSDYMRRSYSEGVVPAPRIEDPAKGGSFVAGTAAVYTHMDIRPSKPSNEQTMFIKPEPPDDYFDNMTSHMNHKTVSPKMVSSIMSGKSEDYIPEDRVSIGTGSSHGMESPTLQTKQEINKDGENITFASTSHSKENKAMSRDGTPNTNNNRNETSMNTNEINLEITETKLGRNSDQRNDFKENKSITCRNPSEDGSRGNGSEKGFGSLERRNITGSSFIKASATQASASPMSELEQKVGNTSRGLDLPQSRSIDLPSGYLGAARMSDMELLIPGPMRIVEVERGVPECSQSRESGYSSPGAASITTLQPLVGHLDLLDGNQDVNSVSTNTRKSWSCEHCDIMFFDGALYFMHMGLHNSEDPWCCNMCSIKFYDVYGFTSHFVNGHS